MEINYVLFDEEEDDTVLIFEHDPIVEILKKRKSFKLKYTYMLETIIADIKCLSFDRMILVEDKIKTEYYKILE